MIVATQVVFSLVIALTLSITFGLILHKEVPRSGFLFFFLMIFLFTLVGGLWFQPFGPAHWGVFWVPMVALGLAGAVFLYYRAPRPPRNRKETIAMLEQIQKRKELEKITYLTMDMLFWFILILLLSAILIYFLKESFF